MSAESVEVQGQAAAAEAERATEYRKKMGAILRELAADVEAGKVPLLAIARAGLCNDCAERHPLTMTYIEDGDSELDAVTLVGLCHLLVSGAQSVVAERMMGKAINRAQAELQARQATKQ